MHRMEGTGTYKEENKVQHVQWTRCQWLMPSHNFRVVLSTFRTLKESGSPSGFSGYYEDRKCRVGRYVMVDTRKHNRTRVVRVVERKTRAYKVTRSELICRDAESFAEELTMPRCICMYFLYEFNIMHEPLCSVGSSFPADTERPRPGLGGTGHCSTGLIGPLVHICARMAHCTVWTAVWCKPPH